MRYAKEPRRERDSSRLANPRDKGVCPVPWDGNPRNADGRYSCSHANEPLEHLVPRRAQPGRTGSNYQSFTAESPHDGVPQKRTVHMSTSTAASLMPVSVKIPEAARLLGFHDSKTIYRLIRAGKLKARKVGHNYLVSYKSIVKLIEG